MSKKDEVFPLRCLLFLPKRKAGVIENGTWETSNQEVIKGYALLPTCVLEKDTEVAQLFLRNDVKILNNLNYGPLLEAVALKDVDTLELIVESSRCENVFDSKITPFFPVLMAGCLYDYERVQLLFGQDAAVYRDSLSDSSSNSCKVADENNAETLEMLLNISTDIGYRSSTGDDGFIHFAARTGDNILIDLLLKYGVSIEATDFSKFTPLLLASLEGHLSTVSLLLEKGANVNAQDKMGSSSLLVACELNNFELAKLLLTNGADINLKNKNGFTPLHFAIAFGEFEPQTSLNDFSNERDNGNGTADFSANTDNFELNASLILELLDRGAHINACASYCYTEGVTPLVLAVESTDLKVIKCLLERGADINIPCYGNGSVLALATEMCISSCLPSHLQVIAEILKYNPDLNSEANKRAVSKAILGRNDISKKVAQMLLQYGFSVEGNCNFTSHLFHQALSRNYIEIVEKFLKSDVSVNAVYSHISYDCYSQIIHCEKTTPLLTAIKHQSNEIVRFLLDFGVDISFNDSDLATLKTAMATACEAKNWTAAKILLQKNIIGGSIAYNHDNFEALMYIDDEEMIKEAVNGWAKKELAGLFSEYIPLSAECGSIKMLKQLIEFGPCIDSRISNGLTALHCVSKSNRNCSEVVELLIKNGADIEARCFNGLTPIAHAAKRGNLKVVMELLMHGAKINSLDHHGFTPLHYAVVKFDSGIFEALLDHAFTDYQLIRSTGILNALEFSVISTSMSRYDMHKEKFQNLTKFLLCSLMKMKAAFPDEESLVEFSSRTVEPALQFSEDDILLEYKYDIGDTPVDIIDLMEKNESELRKMKMQVIDSTSVSLYDILTRDESQLTCYARNQSLVDNFVFEDLEAEFPSYASVMSQRMKKGIFRRKLLDQSIKMCPLLLKDFKILPGNMKEEVLSYLKNGDLEVLINSGERIATAKRIRETPAPS